MRINVNSIFKSKKDEYTPLLEHYKKLIGKYSIFSERDFFNKSVEKAQKQGVKEARKSYENLFLPTFSSYNIVLDERGDNLNSYQFSTLLEGNSHHEISFFIGGSYGLEESFLHRCDKRLSLAAMTMPHRLVKLVLIEQIYRGLTLLNNHPYHK